MRTCRVLLVLLAAVTPLNAATSISWSSGALSVPILRGTTRIVRVSFTASQDFRGLDLRIVPELQPFLRVSPSHYDSVAKNTTTSVELLFSVAESTAARTYNGTVQVRISSGSAGLPSPLSIALVVNNPSFAAIPGSTSLPSLDRFTNDPSGINYAKDEIVVFVDPAATQDQVSSLAARFGAEFLGHDDELNFYQLLLQFPTLDDAMQLILELENEPIVRFAIPHFFEIGNSSETIPNDPSWSFTSRPFRSWAQDLIHLPEAWTIATGDPSVRTGFVDVGFDLNHEDIIFNGSLSDFRFNFTAFRDHGTEVASIAGAVGNNARGLAGAMWAPNLLLFSCSANNDNFVDEPICWSMATKAIDRGARIINVSFAINYSPVCLPSAPINQIAAWLQRSKNGWREVLNHAAGVPIGVLFVFGTGNDRTLFDFTVPAVLSNEFPNNVLSVGAVDRHSNQASYSNYGSISLWAPGGDQPTKMCPNGQRTSPFPDAELPFLFFTQIFAAQANNTYGSVSGTSIAAPFVSGVAGLVLSANSSLTATQLKNIIVSTADDTGHVDSAGKSVRLLNAFRAVQQALAPPVPTRIYVSVPAENRIAVVDPASDQVIDSIPLPSSPQGIAASKDGSFVLAVLSNISQLAKVHLPDKTVTQMNLPGGAVAILPNGQKAYVTQNTATGTSVSVIDPSTLTLTKSITLAGAGSVVNNINIAPSGLKAYVSFGGIDTTVGVIDTTLDQLKATINAQTYYHDEVAFSADSSLAVVSSRGANCPTNGGFSQLDAVNDVFLSADNLTSGKIGVKVSTDKTKAYLPDTCGAGNLLVFALATNTLVDSIPTGLTNEPSAVLLFENTGKAFLVDETGTMSDVNLSARSHFTFPLSTAPFGGILPWTVASGPAPQ